MENRKMVKGTQRPLWARNTPIFFVSAMVAVAVHSSFAADEGVHALRVTTRDGAASVIVGSAHVGVQGMREPDASIFSGARRFVVEHKGEPQPGDGGDVAGTTRAAWAQDLSSSEIAVYLQRAQCAGYPSERALEFLKRPSVQWANQLAYSVCGWHSVPSRDNVLASEKPPTLVTDYLEDDAWVEAKRRSIPQNLSDMSFKWALAHDPAQVWSRVRDAINEGDYEGIREQTDASFGSPENSKRADRIMVAERNEAWMPRLQGYLNEGNAVILVGAMHLPGDKGLIQMLRNSGYRVDAITLPEKSD